MEDLFLILWLGDILSRAKDASLGCFLLALVMSGVLSFGYFERVKLAVVLGGVMTAVFGVLFILLLAVACLAPSKDTLLLYAGYKSVDEGVSTFNDSEIGKKVYKALNKGLDEYLVIEEENKDEY